MMPNRPVWLGRYEIIDRDALFANFQGLLTYGAPLERFCALWSNMVPINNHEDPFRQGAEWINVYDPTDPVGTWISDFNPTLTTPVRPGHAALKPHNFPCRSSAVLLLSHICYFNKSRQKSLRTVGGDQHELVHQVASWLVDGGSLSTRITAVPKALRTFWMPLNPGGTGPGWPVHVRAFWRYVQWVIVGAILTAMALLSLHYVIRPLVRGALQWIGF
jgi:hypothetical protein